MKAFAVGVFHQHISGGWIGRHLLFEDGAARGSGIFRVEIDLPLYECLMRQQSASQIEFAFHLRVKFTLQLLGRNLA